MLPVDPKTGYRYIHVIPSSWGPFVDIRACWIELSKRRPWTHVFDSNELSARFVEMKSDPANLFIVWSMTDARSIARHGRASKLFVVYSEAMDEDGAVLLPSHLAHWHTFKDVAANLDGVFAHTPWMVDMLRRANRPTFVMPAGWDPFVMGGPKRDAHPHQLVSYHGSMVGRREVIVPALPKAFSRCHQDGESRFEDVSGLYGRSLLGKLDTSAVSLYIAHSLVRSFSTWRLWQCASSSTVLVAEPGDTWPFEAGLHYHEIPRFTLDNVGALTHQITGLAQDRECLNEMASEAHALARKYTVDYIEDHFIQPAAV